MKLVANWREELNKAWSVRAAIFTALLGVSDQILTAFLGSGLPPVVYSVLMVVITIAKILDQTYATAAK